MTEQRSIWLWVVGICLFGCGCSSEPPGKKMEPAGGQAAGAVPAAAAAEAPEVEALEPFDPPPLAEIDAKAEWEDQIVDDALTRLHRHLAKSKPLVSVQEALAMPNDSTEANEKIRSALQRPPENEGQVRWDSSMTRHIKGDVSTLNPIMISSGYEMDVQDLINVYLFSFDWDFVPFATSDVVTSWQSSKDRMYDKIVLRRDLTWSDGRPFTAHDVAFSFQAIMNPKIPVPAVRSGTDQLRWVAAYDDYTVVFFHKEGLATNVWNIYFPVIPRHVFEPLYAQLDTISFPELQQRAEYVQTEISPVTSGPYEIVSRTRNQEIVCRRRESWHTAGGKQVREKPYFAECRFRIMEDPNTALLALMSGRLDSLEINPDQWMNQATGADFYAKNIKARGVEWRYFYFGWNTDEATAPFFRDRNVREAMSYAFDYKEMLDKLLYGLCEPCAGDFYPTAWMAPKTPLKPYHQDLDKAAQLLDEAGWVDSDGDGVRDKEIDGRSVPFQFTMVTLQEPSRIRICELMKFNLEQIGVRCEILPLEYTALQDRIFKKNFQAYYHSWGTGADPDTSENLFTTKAITEGRNFVRYSNPEVDRLYEAGKREFDREKRGEIYAKIDEIIYRDQPYTFLFWQNSFYGFNNQLRGFYFSPRGPFSYGPGFFSFWRSN